MSTHGINCQMLSNPLLKQEGESRSPRDTPSGSSNYSTTGSKRAIPASCDILSNLTVDYKLHPSGRISRDPSPMSKMTASVERDKDNKQDKNRRREIKNEKARGKEGYIETEPGRYFERERALDSRVKDGETGWMVRERGHEYNRSPNGGLTSNVKTETEKDMKRRRKKGDTFPRMKRGDIAPDPRLMPTPEIVEERRRRDRPKREETNYWEEKMNWILTKGKEEGKSPGRRPTEDERTQKRETYKVYGIEFQDAARDTIDLQDMRDRAAARKREDMRLDMDERKAGMYSHQRRPDRETHGRKDERRVPKTETYFDDREPSRDKMRERRGEEGYYRDKMSQERGRERQSDRGTGVEGPRRKEEAKCEKYWETDRRTTEQVDRERERWMEAQKIFSDVRKGDDQNRRERRHKEKHERREDATGRNSRSMSDSAPRVPPRVESSAERSRKGDSEKNKRDKDIYREGDTRRKGGAERERIGEKQRDPEGEGAADRSQRQQTRSEKQEKDRGGGTTKSMPEQRRMWLKPHWGKNHTDEDSERYRRPKEGMREKERDVESQAEWGRDGRQVKAELDERYVGQTSSKEGLGGRNEYGGNSDGVSVDGDEIENGREPVREKKGHLSDSDGGTGINQQGGVEGENVVDTTEESGTEEEGGSDYLECSGSDGGSDAGWKQDRDRMLPEDSFGCDEEGDERDEEFRNHGCVSYEYPTAASSKSSEADEREEDWTRKKKVIDKDAQDDDDKSKSWGGMDLRNVLDEIKKCQKNKGLYSATQLYQDYTNTTQDFEILQSLSVSVGEDHNLSPANSPPPSRRPLPPLPTVLHSQSFSHTSAKNLPLPELPRSERRPSSPRLSISLTQQSLLWRDLEDVRYSPELEKLTEDQRRLQEVRFEVVTSEASYCRSLDIVVDHFVKSKQLGVLLNPQDKNWLFSRLAEVRTISRRFLSALEERMESNIMYFTVCDIIAEHCPLFRLVYVPYLTNQSYQDTTYQKLMNENPGFKQLVETLERSPICQRLPLRSFLVLPFQRITRIKLLVQNIVKRTTPGTVEATHAVKALKLLEKLIRDSNESISQMKNLESLVTLNSKVNFECRTLPLVRPSRRLVREGPVTRLSHSLKEPEKNIYLHLFNDNLLLSIPKEGGRFTVIGHYPVESLHADDCPVKLDTLQKNLFRLRILHDLLLLRADSESDKLRWISAISRPHPEFDFSADQDYAQMQCIRAYVAQQPDELSLEKADVILVQQDSDNWVEGTRLSDLHSGWVPKSHLEAIINPKVRKRNLSDALKLTTATATSV